jgi:hypothetical protein
MASCRTSVRQDIDASARPNDENPFAGLHRTQIGASKARGFEIQQGDEVMKKLLVCVIGLAVVLSITAWAQDSMPQDSQQTKAAAAPLMNLKGTVKADGDKLTFVNDKDQKTWEVINPETLKGHEGHHVQLSAHVYADKGQIHVMSVKMLKSGSM